MVVRNATVLAEGKMARRDVRIAGDAIVEVGPELSGEPEEIDAAGLLLLPGVVDAHVHFNEPGRAHWEGFASGSRSLAAGGGTTFIDMPLNAAPPTIDRASFDLKVAAGEAGSVLDFALWGGLIPGNVDRLEELADCGVVGFKAFMIDSGTADFPGVDPGTLREGAKVAARLGLPVAVHAEDPELIAERTAAIRAAGGRDARAWFDSRPVESETRAVRTALDIAGEAGCSLHIVHLSTLEALQMVAEATSVDVTCEVCPHHLLLDESAMDRHGAFAKCAPPLRGPAMRDAVWTAMLADRVDCIGSDHSPAPPDMKVGDDVFEMWGGIMGCQHGFLLLLDKVMSECPERLPEIWALASAAPAARFGVGRRKGRIAPGFDADFILVAPIEERMITAEELLYRHRTSPYVGCPLRLKIVRTFQRGRDVGLPGGGGKFLARNV